MADESMPQDRPVVTRAEAKAAGLKRYFTGVPCKHGHLSERLTDKSHCVECARQATKRWEIANQDRMTAYRAAHYQNNKERHKAQGQAWRAQNRERHNETERARRQANAEYYRAYQKSWRDKHKERLRIRYREYDATHAEKRKAYRVANRDKMCAYSKAHYMANREKRGAQAKVYQAKNRELYRSIMRNRRARVAQIGGTHTAADVERILKSQRGCCAYCRAKLNGKHEIDHIVPIFLGGSNAPKNLQALCMPCNRRKHKKRPEDFARERGLLI